ncbi:DUF2690 domain-containing protein [Streptomyces pathocidini]|uniref:DUF2690 domain-containing protein n=1 Tax=Streptomyces pathocidini TaxID=1650571 RepID=A0ABW7UNY5_9ACTN|nr:DUF2690 domain-containing protein [Streptomyces pathocidini]
MAADNGEEPAEAPELPARGRRRRVLTRVRWRRVSARGRWRRVRDAAKDPQKLVGATVVAVVATVAGGFVTGLFGAGGGSGDGGRADSRPPAVRHCNGAACHGLDVGKLGCDADAQVLQDVRRPVRLQIKYSPSCRAAWAKLMEADPGDAVVITPEGGKGARAVIAYGHDNHTALVGAEGRFVLTACAEPDESGGPPDWRHFCVEATARDGKRR